MRHWFYIQLDASAWPRSGLSPVNRLMAVLIVFAVVVSVLESERELREGYSTFFTATNISMGVLFSAEYFLRMWSIGEDPRFSGLGGRLRYVLSPTALVDLIAIIPFLFTVGVDNAYLLRLFRLLRLLSLAKLGRYSSALQNIYQAVKDRGYELLLSLAAACVVMLLAASALHYAEGARNAESFGSIPRALWWGVATITKVGYGGAFPETILGKVFAALFAIAAVAVVAVPTGILAAAFSDVFQRQREGQRSPTDDD